MLLYDNNERKKLAVNSGRKSLSIDERLIRAGQLVVRTRIFYDIWWFYECPDTRNDIMETIREYSEFFRFDSHARFVSFIVHLAALFEPRHDTINLGCLTNELERPKLISANDAADVNTLFPQLEKRRSVSILRNNALAHRSNVLMYKDAFMKASISPDDLRELTEAALRVVNCLLSTQGLKEQIFSPLPLADAKAILAALAPSEDPVRT